jgi:hypothetical protein
VGWTLGYMVDKLNAGNYLPVEEDSRVLPYFAYIIIVVGLGLIILIPSSMFIFYFCVHRTRHSSLASTSSVKI